MKAQYAENRDFRMVIRGTDYFVQRFTGGKGLNADKAKGRPHLDPWVDDTRGLTMAEAGVILAQRGKLQTN